MHLYYDNVNDAFLDLVRGFRDLEFSIGRDPYQFPHSKTPTRNGLAITIEEPVTITYRNPRYRVLFNPSRDANPFFHMVESLWCLAGRNDIEQLVYYNKEVANFSDDGKIWHGAYGHRWRHWPTFSRPISAPESYTSGVEYLPDGLDQIESVIEVLKAQPTTRRCILQMWTAADLERVRVDPACRDVPCNRSVHFQLRHRLMPWHGTKPVPTLVLDMSVDNRSNDLIWGALGSNYVQFSMLHEYIALAVGAEVGLYHQISSNLHVYVYSDVTGSEVTRKKQSNHFDPAKWLSRTNDIPNPYSDINRSPTPIQDKHPATKGFPQRIYSPHSNGRSHFDLDCQLLFSVNPGLHHVQDFRSPFMSETVGPMLKAWHWHKDKDYRLAQMAARQIASDDWRVACQDWLTRREQRLLGA